MSVLKYIRYIYGFLLSTLKYVIYIQSTKKLKGHNDKNHITETKKT